MKKIIVCLLLLLSLLLALTGCGAAEKEPGQQAGPSASGPAEPGQSEKPDAGEAESFRSYTIGYNNQGSGAWILDYMQAVTEHYAVEVLGMQINAMSANFSADQMVNDIKNQVSAGEDAHLFYGTFGTQAPIASDLFRQAGITWASHYQCLVDAGLEYALEDPCYVGSVGVDNAVTAEAMAKTALEMGFRKAVILAGAIGDVAVDARVNTFTQVFEAGGGQILGVGRDDVETAQKADDLMAAYGTEIDCAYGICTPFTEPLINAAKSYGVYDNITFFTGDLDSAMVGPVKEGRVIGWSHGVSAGAYATALLVNSLDGHRLLDESGQVPCISTMPVFRVDQENAETYETYWIAGNAVDDADYKQLLYRFNPEVSYESFLEFVNSVDMDYASAR